MVCNFSIWMTNDKKFLLRIFRQNEIKAIFTYNFFVLLKNFWMLNFYLGTWDLARNSNLQIADKNIDDKDDTKEKVVKY